MTNAVTASVPVLDVYARISRAADGDTIKVDDQVELCLETLAKRGALPGEIFRDHSLSAWDPKVVRPQWEQLMSRLESGASHGVIVYDLFRFSRKVIEGERLVELASRGIRVWSLAGEYDLMTADGRRHFREAMVAAAGESDKMSERCLRGQLRRARRGKQAGGPRRFAQPGYVLLPPGWEKGDPRDRVPEEQVQAERELIRTCYDRLFAGESISSIVRFANSTGIQTAYGGRWQRRTVVRTLILPSLAGLIAHHNEVVGELRGAIPVVSREEWERMRALIDAQPRGRPAGRVHVLSGLVRCGRCGRMLLGAPRAALPPYPDGAKKREYRCRETADGAGCGNHIDARAAESAVAEAVKVRLGDPRSAERLAARLAEVTEDRSRIEGEIATLEQAADDLADKTATWGVGRIDRSMQPILRRLARLRSELAALDSRISPADLAAAAADAVAAWNEAASAGDMAAMRAMIRRTLPALALRPGRYYRDHSPERFDWDGTGASNAA
ncbi:MAG: recombinase family protein [Sporichthyaceae bacterium]|nr:recombinase family protein [Sporichthyaceae bacterium]